MKISRKAPTDFMNYELSLNPLEQRLFGPTKRMGNLNQKMFKDDFRNIFVGSSRRNADIFNISSNNDQIQEKLLGSFISRGRISKGHFDVEGIVEEVTQSLLHYGKAAYFLQDDKHEGSFIRPLPSNTIFKFLGLVFQYVPKHVQHNWDSDDVVLGREIRLMERPRVLLFDWKNTVLKKISAQNRILKTLDRYTYEGASKHIPRPTHENPNPKNYFDFSVWKEAQDDALFMATKLTGWSGRKSSQPNRSDFFICHRLIRFRKLQVELATHILDTLSKQLTAIGKREVADFELKISFSDEFQSVRELENLEHKLESEEVSFREVLDYCYQS